MAVGGPPGYSRAMSSARRGLWAAAVLVVLALAVNAPAQTAPKYAVGQRVETNTYGTGGVWTKGTITAVNDDRPNDGNLKYAIHLDKPAPGYTETDVSAFENEVRPLVAFTPFKVGTVVDVYYEPGVGRDRGIVRAVTNDGRYRIHFPGCEKGRDELIDHDLVKKPRHLSRSSRKVRFLVGKWIMFTPSYPNTVIHDGEIYREYGTGARTPPLTIRSNGRYVWYFDFGKKPVRGRWKPDARIPGTDTGTATVDGVVIKDPGGNPWKVYRRKADDHKDHITAQRMCSGMADIGTRAR